MSTIVVGLIDGINRAGRALAALEACGFSREDLSLVTPENREMSLSGGPGANSTSYAVSQLHAFDADLSQALRDAQCLSVDGIGSAQVTGPFTLTLEKTRSARGTVELHAALTALDLPDSDASCYAEAVRRGGSLVLVNAPDHMVDRALDVLLLHNAVEPQQRMQRWQQQGWKHFDPSGHPCTSEEITREWFQQANDHQHRSGFHPYDRDFRCHYYLTYPYSHEPYEQYALAYRYGYRLGCDQNYRGKDWFTIESHVRRQWERQEEPRWEAVVDAIYYGFTKAQEHFQLWTMGTVYMEQDHEDTGAISTDRH